MKSYIKNILILVLLTLIVLPFILKKLNVYEGMNGGCVADYSDSDTTTENRCPVETPHCDAYQYGTCRKTISYYNGNTIYTTDTVLDISNNSVIDKSKEIGVMNASDSLVGFLTTDHITKIENEEYTETETAEDIMTTQLVDPNDTKCQLSYSTGILEGITKCGSDYPDCSGFELGICSYDGPQQCTSDTDCPISKPKCKGYGGAGTWGMCLGENEDLPSDFNSWSDESSGTPETGGTTGADGTTETGGTTGSDGTPGSDLDTIQNETEIGKPVPENIESVDRIESDEAGSHHYCLGGNLYCKYDDASLNFVETYKFGKTYKNTCSDGNKVICNGRLRNEDVNSIKLYEINEYGEKVENTQVEYNKSTTFSGLTEKLDYTPVNMNPNGDYLIYYKPGEDKEYKTDRCALFGPDKCIAGNLNGEGDPESDVSESSCDFSIKCVANYGSKPGDSKCCGQKGRVTQEDKVCPKELPVCSGYKCGEQWGVCKAQ